MIKYIIELEKGYVCEVEIQGEENLKNVKMLEEIGHILGISISEK